MTESSDRLLWDAYRGTVFEATTTAGLLAIGIGRSHPAFDRLAEQHAATAWCFVTAWNPASELLSVEHNRERNQRLHRELKERSIVAFASLGRGQSPRWRPEESFLALGVAPETAIALGRRWGQNAVVWGARGGVAELVDCRGKDATDSDNARE